MSDPFLLVERLRQAGISADPVHQTPQDRLLCESADEIERLTREVELFGAWQKRDVAQAAEIERLTRELQHFTQSGIVEIAVRNPSVREYMEDWEGRTLRAEADRDRLERDTWKNRVASLCDRLDRIHLLALDRSLHANERLIRIRREAEGFARVPGAEPPA